MSSVEEQVAHQIANLERATGRRLDEWIAVVRASGLEKHGEAVAMLKRASGRPTSAPEGHRPVPSPP